VPASSPAVLLALVLLVGATATAQPRAIPCEAGTRRIELKTEPSDEVPEMCVSPGLSTTILLYGAELLPGGVTVDGRERFTLVEVGNTVLRLVPSERVVPGERLRLTVRFREGAAPASAAFWLVVYAGQVEPLVEVYREKRTVESYQQQVQEKDSQFRQCQEDNERLLAEKESPGGLAGLFAMGFMDDRGVTSKDLTKIVVAYPGNAVLVLRVFSYRSTSRVAVELILRPTPGMEPWKAVRAELVGPGRRALRVKPPWQREPLRYEAEDRRMVIEAEATAAETRGSFTLKVWDADGTRVIILTGVVFP
jgi:uncharacterized protein (TIGR02268 family)